MTRRRSKKIMINCDSKITRDHDQQMDKVLEKNTEEHIINTADTLREEDIELKEYIGSINEAPPWERDNEFILTGYRINYNSWSSIFRSILEFHNETVNIWSHLLGALLFVALVAAMVISAPTLIEKHNKSKAHKSGTEDPWKDNISSLPLCLQYLCISICLLCSCTYHCGMPYSR